MQSPLEGSPFYLYSSAHTKNIVTCENYIYIGQVHLESHKHSFIINFKLCWRSNGLQLFPKVMPQLFPFPKKKYITTKIEAAQFLQKLMIKLLIEGLNWRSKNRLFHFLLMVKLKTQKKHLFNMDMGLNVSQENRIPLAKCVCWDPLRIHLLCLHFVSRFSISLDIFSCT